MRESRSAVSVLRVASLGLAVLLAGAASAATIYVDIDNQSGLEDGSQSNPYNSIQQAIASAQNGDTVQVAPGTYHETVFMKDGVDLIGAGAGVTTIDATGRSNSVVRFEGTRFAPRLEGFTLTGGIGDRIGTFQGSPVTVGGGILIRDSSPVITGNVISGNTVDVGIVRGGGIYASLSQSVPVIQGNVIRDNVAVSADLPDRGEGGGVYVSSKNAGVVLLENRIEGNDAFRGGGIHTTSTGTSTTRIERNTIVGNTAAEGAGIFTRDSETSEQSILNNLIVDNGSVFGRLDCDDANDVSSPLQPELCDDGIDNDCNPATPDIFDADGDGDSCDVDCRDDVATLGPSIAENCLDEIDNDCDGAIDALDPDNVTVVQAGSAMRYRANTTNPGIGITWVAPGFDDSSWTAGVYGVGYETEPPGVEALATTTVATGAASVYTRSIVALTADELAGINGVFLGADYDDGWVAWLNGVEVYRSPEMAAGGPAWNASPSTHESSNGATPDYGTPIDVSVAALPLLVEGDNVLAVGVYNDVPGTSPDLLLVPRLGFAVGVSDTDCLCPDLDGDGYACSDCDDADPAVNPGTTEQCNDGIDNDCDVATPDVFDVDGDGYSCAVDCDDADAAVNPAAAELDCDGIDNDCNPGTPDVVDRDGDLYDCTVDCNDAAFPINPGAVEFCFDGIDNNCNSSIDAADFECMCAQPGDADGDGYLCRDCDDGNPDVNPGANEICNDGIDNDCSPSTPDIFDADGDGTPCDLDCRDFDPESNPDAAEVCNDGIDNDCDGDVDGADADCACGDGDGDGYSCTDCDDAVASTNPGAPELCNDGVDNDCDPATLDVDDRDGDGADCTVDCDDLSAAVGPTASEACDDGLDNDCNGLYDLNDPDRVLVALGSAMRYVANLSDPGLGIAWTDPGFNDTAWANGLYGVGYQVGPPTGGANDLIVTDVPVGTLSVYTRARFDIPDPAGVNAMSLGADWDDGYVVWLNGVEVHRSPEMPAGVPVWNANPALHESSNAAVPDYGTLIDISSSALPLLQAGTNVLAVGLYNNEPPGGGASSDLVIVPRLAMDFGSDDPNCLCVDLDGDGYAGGECAVDCNDSVALINPGQPEVGCDGLDNDCNPATVDILDADGDGVTCDMDCNDAAASINPSAMEVPCDFLDNDCNASTPDVVDADADGFDCNADCDDGDNAINPFEVEIGCDNIDNDCSTLTSDFVDGDGDGATCDVDCDDTNPAIGPAAAEKCDDGVDNDCNGLTDMADLAACDCTDPDADGYRCADCAPGNFAINPGVAEVCNDGLDNDCNPATADLGDLDGDGYDCLADCDDANPFVNPGVLEQCNDGIDNDCDPATVDLFDRDEDGVTCDLDCNDQQASTYPMAPELCSDGIDNDCNAATPDVFDMDGDGFLCTFDCRDDLNAVNPNATEICNDGIDNDCDPTTPDLYDEDGDGATCDVDCDDTNPLRYPGAPEKCDDGIDNDCDGLTDMADTAACSCTDPDADGYRCDDCLPGNGAVNPGATEVCNDGLDNDCNPSTPDVGDLDGDGVSCLTDCNDFEPLAYPGLAEICNDGIDNDCNPGTPDLFDLDGDGSPCDVDCDDGNFDVNPGQAEVGCDGLDNDCDGMTPDVADLDGDGSFCVDERVRGGAISSLLFGGARLRMLHNTMVGNDLALGRGGAVFIDDILSSQISVIAGNAVNDNSALVGGGIDHSLFSGQLRGNLVSGNAPDDLYNGSASAALVADNLSSEPEFSSSASGNYRPAVGSPLIDGALPQYAPNVDLDRFGRPFDGDDDAIALADIGAFEYPSGEVFDVLFLDRNTLEWEVRAPGQVFNVYRGNLAGLRAGGNYTQAFGGGLAAQFCAVPAAGVPFVDGFAPTIDGSAVFYLITTVTPGFEGSLGTTSSGVLRPNANSCP